MNRIPKNYISKLNLRETQEAQNFIKNELISLIDEHLEVLLIREPKVSANKISASGFLDDNDRTINFDSSNDNVIHVLYSQYRYWLTDVLKKLDIKNNNGIAVFTNYISRDSQITNISSFEKNLLQIEYRYDNLKDSYTKAKELTEILSKIFYKLEAKVIKRYKLDKKIPMKITLKEVNKFGNKKYFESTSASIASERGVFIFSNKRKSKSDKSIFNNFELLLLAYSKPIDKAYTIFSIQDRMTLEELEPLTADSEITMEEYLFRKNILKNEDIKSINISIDLDTLSMFLLEKIHILEIQTGNSVEEIEKILSSADIKHL